MKARHVWFKYSKNTIIFLFKNIFYLFIFREQGKGGRKSAIASHVPLVGDLAYNPGMCRRLGIEPVTL